jgi:hypothetical protein
MVDENENENDEGVTGADASDALGAMNFDVNDEYKPTPLIPSGTYHANAVAIKLVPAKFSIEWSWCLHDNGGTMNDGETQIDGARVVSRNWLPKPGDESNPTKDGKSNKRQSKINQLKDFQDALGIDMSTPQKIATALAESQWIGVEADIEVSIEEWNGRFRNSVGRVKKSQM